MQILETDRLVIRQFDYNDCEFILRLLNDPSFVDNIEDKGVRTRVQAASYLAAGPMASYQANGHGLYLVALKDGGRPIGMCGLIKRPHLRDVDLGYAFLPEGAGRGYAFEAAAAVLDFGHRTLGFTRVCAIVSPTNLRSTTLLERLGFAFAQWQPMPGGPGSIALYELDLENWLQAPTGRSGSVMLNLLPGASGR